MSNINKNNVGGIMKLSKSKYCSGIQCKKILWLNKNKPDVKADVNNESVLENGTEVGILARSLFGNHIEINYSNNLSDMINQTNKVLNDNNVVVCEASFEYDGLFCSIDILKKNNNDIPNYNHKIIIEVDLSDMTFIRWLKRRPKSRIRFSE